MTLPCISCIFASMQKPAPIKRDFLTVAQAADRLNLSERTITDWITKKIVYAEPLDPGRTRTPQLIPLSEIERVEAERAALKA